MRQKENPLSIDQVEKIVKEYFLRKGYYGKQFIRKHSRNEGEIDMKHLIIVKFKEEMYGARERKASREMLADIRGNFDRTKQIRRRPYGEHL